MGHRLYRQQELSPEQLAGELLNQPRTTARLLICQAARNDPEAQALLGQILLDGQGIRQDARLALCWFRMAARQGHAMACNMAGRCLEHGWTGKSDPAAAASYYRQAACCGLDWGFYNLANLLATGRGVPRDEHRAFALYLKAAQMGHAKSMNLVGRYCEEGRASQPADRETAARWYQRSAEAGDFRGQFSHACLLADRGDWSGARYWLEQALAGGHLKFLRRARDELLAARWPALQDISQAYVRRCQHLEQQGCPETASQRVQI